MSDRFAAWVYDHPDVWTSPWRLGGVPCVRGTRVPVDNISHLFTDPLTDRQIVDDYYPSVSTWVCARLRAAYEKHGGTWK